MHQETDPAGRVDPLTSTEPKPEHRDRPQRKSWISGVVKRLKKIFRKKKAGKKFHLHLGVHKTATTYTQSALSDNNGTLRENGILYWDLGFTRKNITPFLKGLCRKKKHPAEAEECEMHLRELFGRPEVKKSQRVLISDENLLGFITDIIRHGGYKGVFRRFKPIHLILNHDVKVYITIRNYADFFSSVYCELITTKPYVPFERLRENPALMEFSWLSVYKDLVRVFGRKNVVVFEFQTAASNLTGVVAEMLGSPIELKMPGKQIRVSPSGKAVDCIRLAQESNDGQKPLREIVKTATQLFPKNPENPSFDPWTAHERASLDKRYKEELQKIPCWHP